MFSLRLWWASYPRLIRFKGPWKGVWSPKLSCSNTPVTIPPGPRFCFWCLGVLSVLVGLLGQPVLLSLKQSYSPTFNIQWHHFFLQPHTCTCVRAGLTWNMYRKWLCVSLFSYICMRVSLNVQCVLFHMMGCFCALGLCAYVDFYRQVWLCVDLCMCTKKHNFTTNLEICFILL